MALDQTMGRVGAGAHLGARRVCEAGLCGHHLYHLRQAGVSVRKGPERG